MVKIEKAEKEETRNTNDKRTEPKPKRKTFSEAYLRTLALFLLPPAVV